jgi:6-phosphofructokinase 1
VSRNGKVGIVVGGGPAPGINSVIGAASIRARLAGLDVLGLRDGFKWVMEGDAAHVDELTIDSVSRIHFRGGSILGTSRANPTKRPETLERSVRVLVELGIDRLITIGGDDTLFTASRLAEAARDRLAVVHVPKTIDNDLDLPNGTPTFGFETARHVGCQLVGNLMTDAETTSRWYFVVAMGRKAGHLALGIGKAAGASLTLIPEEFPEPRVRLGEVVDTLAGAVIKRKAYGRADGVAVIAEGVIERLAPEDLAQIGDVQRDPHGNLRFAEVEFGRLLKMRVEERLERLHLKATIVAKDIGYELRCADPIPFDMDYTRNLGYAAAKCLIDGGDRVVISMIDGRMRPIPFAQMMDGETGKTRVRMVDIGSHGYQIARRYMLRLRRDDFANADEIARFAKECGIGSDEFRAQFEYVVRAEPPPLEWAPRLDRGR